MNKQTWLVKAFAVPAAFLCTVSAAVAYSCLCALLAMPTASSAQAANTIQAVTASVQGGSEVIRIDLTAPLAAVPTGFSIQSPARIALDFPGVANAMGRSAVDVNVGNLRSANVVQAVDARKFKTTRVLSPA